ncbi:MAG: hypothetical protein HOC71_10445 [Candidatus Latescibacteria bacterium]|nr:hypothetical protein [Candidatus Latescibacterota bacterium]
MVKKNNNLFIFFALLALFLIGADYVCGHMGENPFGPNNCPLCSAFQSAELSHILLFSILAFGILPVSGFFRINCLFSPISIYLTTYSLRAPPCTR